MKTLLTLIASTLVFSSSFAATAARPDIAFIQADDLGWKDVGYRNQPGAMASLTDGLNRLRENAVQLARTDAREVISRFGQMGTRKLAAVG